jgi:hypothetical protein
MSNRKQQVKEELNKLIEEGKQILHSQRGPDNKKPTTKLVRDLKKNPPVVEYQGWYSKSLPVVQKLLPERDIEFQEQYQSSNRKEGQLDAHTFAIIDYLRGFNIQTVFGQEVFNTHRAFYGKFQHQIAILMSAVDRLDSLLNDITGILQADLFDNELDAARELLTNGYLRPAGTLAGVTLERHLAKVANNHGIALSKPAPTIADWNDELRQQSIYDIVNWRFVQMLGDIRNLSAHAKNSEPTKEKITEMIDGVQKVVDTIC